MPMSFFYCLFCRIWSNPHLRGWRVRWMWWGRLCITDYCGTSVMRLHCNFIFCLLADLWQANPVSGPKAEPSINDEDGRDVYLQCPLALMLNLTIGYLGNLPEFTSDFGCCSGSLWLQDSWCFMHLRIVQSMEDLQKFESLSFVLFIHRHASKLLSQCHQNVCPDFGLDTDFPQRLFVESKTVRICNDRQTCL